MTPTTQYLNASFPALLPHPDGTMEQIEVDRLPSEGSRWLVAMDEVMELKWFLPQPPVRDEATGFLIAIVEPWQIEEQVAVDKCMRAVARP